MACLVQAVFMERTMSENSKIEWTDHTFNPWEGCQKVGPGCDNCYAEAWDKRYNKGAHWGAGAPRRSHASSLRARFCRRCSIAAAWRSRSTRCRMYAA